MNFNEALLADIDKVTRDAKGAGIDIILVDADGVEHPMRAFFDAPQGDVVPGSASAPVISGAPVLHIPSAYVTSALQRPLTTRESFSVLYNGESYTCQAPRDDSHGMVVVKLQRKGASPAPFPPIPTLRSGGGNG